MTRRRGPRPDQMRLPDWVWGVGFGVIILVFIGGYFAIDRATGSSGGSNRCDEELVPLGSSQISAEAFQQEDEGLARVIEALERNDRAGADAAFYGPVHNFTHNVDPPLRAEDPDAAKALCEEVLEIEEELVVSGSNEDVLESVIAIRQILREAAVTLGYPAPS
jgi:hypothetical protein